MIVATNARFITRTMNFKAAIAVYPPKCLRLSLRPLPIGPPRHHRSEGWTALVICQPRHYGFRYVHAVIHQRIVIWNQQVLTQSRLYRLHPRSSHVLIRPNSMPYQPGGICNGLGSTYHKYVRLIEVKVRDAVCLKRKRCQ